MTASKACSRFARSKIQAFEKQDDPPPIGRLSGLLAIAYDFSCVYSHTLLRGLIELSQAKLAKELGVTLRTVSRWERGEFPIPRVAELALRNLFRESLKETNPWEKIKKDLKL